MHHLPQALEDGQVDLIITWSGEIPYLDARISSWKKFLTPPDAVFIPRGHPLFDKPLTSLAECRPYPFITLSLRATLTIMNIWKHSVTDMGSHLSSPPFAAAQTPPAITFPWEKVST